MKLPRDPKQAWEALQFPPGGLSGVATHSFNSSLSLSVVKAMFVSLLQNLILQVKLATSRWTQKNAMKKVI